MNGAQTDPVSVAPYIVASSAILRVSRQFFHPDSGQDSLSMQRWSATRRFADLLLSRGALQLTGGEKREFRDLLSLAANDSDVAFLRLIEFTERA